MAWNVLQSVSGYATANGVASVSPSSAWAGNLTHGSKLIAYVTALANASGVNVTCSGVQDGNGNGFTKVAEQNTYSGGYYENFYIFELDTPVADEGTKPVITASFANYGSASYGCILVQEVTGLLPGTSCLDGAAGVTGGRNGGDWSTGSPSYASTAAGELLVSFYGDDGDGSGAPTWTAPGGTYTTDAKSVNTSGWGNIAVSYASSANGTETGSYSIAGVPNTAGWGLILAAFKLAGTQDKQVDAGAAEGTAGAAAPFTTGGTPLLYAGSATGISGSWANTAGAAGSTQGDYATWTDSGAGTSAVLELSAFGADAAVPAGSTVTGVTCTVRHGETPAAQIASVTAQAYSGATPVGSPQALTVADAVHDDVVTFAGLAYADLADLRVRVTVTRN